MTNGLAVLGVVLGCALLVTLVQQGVRQAARSTVSRLEGPPGAPGVSLRDRMRPTAPRVLSLVVVIILVPRLISLLT